MNNSMLILLGILSGWIGGVITNYLADVLPYYRRLTYPVCRYCGNQYKLIDYFLIPKKCTVCGRRRDRSWLVGLGLIIIFLLVFHYSSINLHILFQFIVIVYFSVVTVIDIEHRLILNLTSLLGAIIGILVGYLLHGFQQTILGGIAGYFTMFGLHSMGGIFLARLSKRRDRVNNIEALGFGDVTLGGVLGLFMGFPGIFIALIIAILSAGLISLIVVVYKLAIRQYSRDLAIPYGPFLVLGAFVLLYFNEFVLRWIY